MKKNKREVVQVKNEIESLNEIVDLDLESLETIAGGNSIAYPICGCLRNLIKL